MNFLNSAEVTLDAKGRFLLPLELKKDLNVSNSTEAVFVIKLNGEIDGGVKCLDLVPINEWHKLGSFWKSLDPYDPEVKDYVRMVTRGCKNIGVDSIGRILLPKELIEDAGLKKDLILAPQLNGVIEIWEKENYKKFFENYSSRLPHPFRELEKKFMSKTKTL